MVWNQRRNDFTIEPMINSGGPAVRLLSDGDSSNKRSLLSAQWEHTILVTNDGYEVLTLAPDERFNCQLDDQFRIFINVEKISHHTKQKKAISDLKHIEKNLV